MASLSLCCARIPPSQLGIVSHLLKFMPFLTVPSLPFTFRHITPFTLSFKNTVRLQIKQILGRNLNPSEGDSIQEKSDGTKISDAAQGPPFLTILAEFVVFFLDCWIVGSFVLSLIGLIVKLPPSK